MSEYLKIVADTCFIVDSLDYLHLLHQKSVCLIISKIILKEYKRSFPLGINFDNSILQISTAVLSFRFVNPPDLWDIPHLKGSWDREFMLAAAKTGAILVTNDYGIMSVSATLLKYGVKTMDGDEFFKCLGF